MCADNETNDKQKRRTDTLWLIFKLKRGFYGINSEMITSIINMPENITAMPNAPKHMSGLMNFRGNVIPLLDMRILFDMGSLKKEYEAFKEMLDLRKQDHIHWVAELVRTVKEEEAFTLPIDPHQCAFGKWYDHFKSDLPTITFHMKKIEEPHAQLHAAADAIKKCSQQHDLCKREECLKITLQKAQEKLMPQVLQLLEEAKQVFMESYQNKVIVLETDLLKIGLIVDEVLAVEKLFSVSGYEDMRKELETKGIAAIGQGAESDDLVLMLDEKQFIDMIKENAGDLEEYLFDKKVKTS